MKKWWGLLALAAVCFAGVFAAPYGNFWVKITLTVLLLTGLSGIKPKRPVVNPTEIVIGILGAVVLYGIFWFGNYLSSQVFSFAPEQVDSIYAIKQQGNKTIIAAILLLITSPGEEIFWRGYIQQTAMNRWGRIPGCLAGIAAYAGVHVASGNFMLVGAALTAGVFWCLLYSWRRNLTACVISHCLWTVGVFLLFPIR